MLGHPDISRDLVFSRQTALLHEASEHRLARADFAAIAGETRKRRPFLGRLADLLRWTEPDFGCVQPECLPARY